MEKEFHVYMLASGRKGTLYVGMSSNRIQRVWQHKNDLVEGFTKRYRVHDLVWFEQQADAYGLCRCDSRAADQGVEAWVEDRPDRASQSCLA